MKYYLKIAMPLLITSLLMVHQAASQSAISLMYKLPQGKVYELKVNTDQTITMDLMGQDMVINQLIEVYQDVEVLEVDPDGNHTMGYTYKRVKLNQNAMGMEVVYDSDEEVETDDMMVKQLVAALGDVVGSTATTTIGRLGNPVESALDEYLPKGANVSGAESGLLSIFPERPISVGDTWEVEIEIDVTVGFKVKTTFTLSEINGNDAIILIEGLVENTIHEDTTMYIEGDIAGKLTVDIPTGWTKSASYKQNMYMEMEEEGVRMPMKFVSVTELSSL